MEKIEHRIELSDDGTMDTVLRCPVCGATYRYNFDEGDYDAFVKWAIEDATNEHCTPDAPFCGCEMSRHFNGEAGHPYGQGIGTPRPTTVYGLVGEPFCQYCQEVCEPEYLAPVSR